MMKKYAQISGNTVTLIMESTNIEVLQTQFGGLWVEIEEHHNCSLNYLYYSGVNKFVKPQPYPSWTLSKPSYLWVPPVDEPEPDDNLTYTWNEDTESWDSTPR